MTKAVGKHPLKVILLTFAVLTPAALAQSENDFGGTWIVPVGSQTFAVVQLAASPGNTLTGTISMPQHFDTDGVTISDIQLPARTAPIDTATAKDHALHIVTHSPSDPTDKDEFVLTFTGKNEATLDIIGAPFDSWPVLRVQHPATVSTDFDPKRKYFFLDSDIASREMQNIFREDQLVRKGVVWTKAYANSIAAGDSERHQQVKALLSANKLYSGSDFEQAAFIFQHGDTPKDFLLAHTLALAALARGKQDAYG